MTNATKIIKDVMTIPSYQPPPASQVREQTSRCANLQPLKLYGISNCNTVKKTRDWLAQHDITIEFHDFKKQGLDAKTLENWLQQYQCDVLINRKGLTWRALTDEQKQQVTNNSSSFTLMLEKTSIIKRPLLEQQGKLLHIGFDAAAYARIFKLKEPT